MNNQDVKNYKQFLAAFVPVAFADCTARRRELVKAKALEFVDAFPSGAIGAWDDTGSDCFYEYFDRYVNHIIVDKSGACFIKENPRHFANQLLITIRSALDAVIGDGFGVIGFTVGDLMDMFGGELPEFVSRNYTSDIMCADRSAYIML